VSNANQASSFRPVVLCSLIVRYVWRCDAITLRMRIAISSTWDFCLLFLLSSF